jgi:DNA-binding HxlR family transcriptional regulator
LSERLKSLEASGMIERFMYNDHPPRAMYKLSEKGKAFVPVLIAIRDYGNEWEKETRTQHETPAEVPTQHNG